MKDPPVPNEYEDRILVFVSYPLPRASSLPIRKPTDGKERLCSVSSTDRRTKPQVVDRGQDTVGRLVPSCTKPTPTALPMGLPTPNFCLLSFRTGCTCSGEVYNSAEVLEQRATTTPSVEHEDYDKLIHDQTVARALITIPNSYGHRSWWPDSMQDNFFLDNRPFLDLSAPDESHPSLTFPKYCSPVGFSDKQVFSMVEEGRRELQRGHFETRTVPSLKRLLSDPPFDCLSFRLLRFIRKYGAVSLQNLLFTFWVQYLSLRARNLTYRSEETCWLTRDLFVVANLGHLRSI